MSQELSQAQLEELVNGKQQKPRAVFYQRALLNVERSKEENRRVYDKVLYVKIKQPGVTDWVAYKAQTQDIADYPEEYQIYQKTKQGTQDAGVEIIPQLDMAHLQELIDIGLSTIPLLAEAKQVPPHLEYARLSAIALNAVLKENYDGQKEGNEENSKQEDEQRVSAPSGRIDPDRVERSELSASDGGEDEETAEGLHTSGCFDGGKGLIDSFHYDFNLTRH